MQKCLGSKDAEIKLRSSLNTHGAALPGGFKIRYLRHYGVCKPYGEQKYSTVLTYST